MATMINTTSGIIKIEGDIIYSDQGNPIGSLRHQDLQSEGIKHQGLRYNQGKLRYDLVDSWAHEQLVKVFTKGSEKYRTK